MSSSIDIGACETSSGWRSILSTITSQPSVNNQRGGQATATVSVYDTLRKCQAANVVVDVSVDVGSIASVTSAGVSVPYPSGTTDTAGMTDTAAYDRDCPTAENTNVNVFASMLEPDPAACGERGAPKPGC